MKHFIQGFLGTALLSFVVAWPLSPVACNQPVHNPVSPEYPCGTRAHVCISSGLCCWNDYICGGDPGVLNCPPGMCCFQGDNWLNLSVSDRNQTKP